MPKSELHFLGHTIDLLTVETNYNKPFHKYKGNPSFYNEGGLLSFTFGYGENYRFLERMTTVDYDLYKKGFPIDEGKIVFYDDDGFILKTWYFQDAAIVYYKVSFDTNGGGMMVEMLVSPAIQNYGAKIHRWWHESPIPEEEEYRSPIVSKQKEEKKIIEDITKVYFIFYTSGDFEEAAKTRKKEIKSIKDELNHVFIFKYQDLWEIKTFVDSSIEKVKANKWGKTIEMCIFSHGGVDGPVGEIKTSKYNLADITGKEAWDKKQMSLDGWSQINFNFDSNNSIASFYGCKNVTFAENFLDIQNVKFTAAHGGSSADSESFKELNSSWVTFSEEKIYYVSPTGENNSLAPMEIMKKGGQKWKRSIENDEIFTNISLDKDGNLYGLGKNGKIVIPKDSIKYAKYNY